MSLPLLQRLSNKLWQSNSDFTFTAIIDVTLSYRRGKHFPSPLFIERGMSALMGYRARIKRESISGLKRSTGKEISPHLRQVWPSSA